MARDMMETTSEAMNLALAAFKKEYGEDAILGDGEEFFTVFNDGVLVIGKEEGTLTVHFSVGKPYFVDYDLDMLEKDEPEAEIDGK